MPALILFMFIGMLFGSDGIFKISFDNFKVAENVCAVALVFIMFYGGFNTKWSVAKSVASKSITLSTAGVVLTAGITAILCHIVLKMSVAESFLIGSVLSSTDAASVFAILRRKKLNLKYGTASILEVESGSNDPVSYLLTIIAISMLSSGDSINLALTITQQILLGIAVGVILAQIALYILTKTPMIAEGLDAIFLISVVLLCYGATSIVGGNAYLSIYLFGIIIGNSNIKNKKTLVPFFDGITSLAQILIFFLIGLLTFPHEMPAIIPTAFMIVLFLTLIARPVAVFLLMSLFKCPIKQCVLISWAGLRGASSSVFAIMAVANGVAIKNDLFHIVFMVSLFSVSIQGTLLPWFAKKLDMVDDTMDVRKTFNDYQDDASFQLMRMHIPHGHSWENKKIKDVHMPTGSLAIMIKRKNETLITKGDTQILAGDDIILSVPPYTPNSNEKLEERHIDILDEWYNQAICDLKIPDNVLITMIIRNDETIIPDGKTVLLENDVVVIMKQ
jgi:cell volume regulation protein A